MKYLYILIVFLFSFTSVNAEEDHESHEHAHETEESSHEHKHEDEKEHEHGAEQTHKSDDHDNHEDHAEEENDSIGPTKGILAKSENGFRLTEVAIKNFGLKYKKINSSNFEINESAIVKVLDGKFIFRERDGWFKKIPVKISRKTEGQYSVSIADIKSQDRVIIAGVGFLRTAELVVEEGVAHGHSH